MAAENKPDPAGTSLVALLAIAGVGIGLVLLSAVFGMKHIGAEVVFDLGIACLILVGVEILLQRAISRISQVTAGFFQRSEELEAFYAAQESLYTKLYDPDLDEARKAEIRVEIERSEQSFIRAQTEAFRARSEERPSEDEPPG